MLSEAETAQLTSIARSRSMAAALTQRAQIVLDYAGGESNHAVAQRLSLTDATVGKWRRRFLRYRIQGLYDELRPGRPRLISEERVARLIRKTLQSQPRDGSTHWSVRSAARASGICKSSVQRYFDLFGVQPQGEVDLNGLRTTASPCFGWQVKGTSADRKGSIAPFRETSAVGPIADIRTAHMNFPLERRSERCVSVAAPGSHWQYPRVQARARDPGRSP